MKTQGFSPKKTSFIKNETKMKLQDISNVAVMSILHDKAVMRSKFKVANAFMIKEARKKVTELSSKLKKLESKVA